MIEGKSYSIKEVEENKDKFQKYFGGDATKIGKDRYVFTLENPMYGFNSVSFTVTDNGKRVGSTSIQFTVQGDNSIEFTNPLNDSVIMPGTDVVIETVSKLNDGMITKIDLIGNALCCGNPPLMKQVSRKGNTYNHQYLWKNIAKGYYSLQILLTEDSGAFTYSKSLQFKVTEKPSVRITSIKNGQVFNVGEDIPIEIDAIDPDGEVKDVSIPVDGKYDRYFAWSKAGRNRKGFVSNLRQGVHTLYAKVTDDMDVEAVSETITIIVK